MYTVLADRKPKTAFQNALDFSEKQEIGHMLNCNITCSETLSKVSMSNILRKNFDFEVSIDITLMYTVLDRLETKNRISKRFGLLRKTGSTTLAKR